MHRLVIYGNIKVPDDGSEPLVALADETYRDVIWLHKQLGKETYIQVQKQDGSIVFTVGTPLPDGTKT